MAGSTCAKPKKERNVRTFGDCPHCGFTHLWTYPSTTELPAVLMEKCQSCQNQIMVYLEVETTHPMTEENFTEVFKVDTSLL